MHLGLQPTLFVDQHFSTDSDVLDIFQSKRIDYSGTRADILKIAAIVKLGFEEPIPMRERLGFLD